VLPEPVSAAIAKAASAILPVVGKKLHDRNRQRAVIDEAREIFLPEHVDRAMHGLDADQVAQMKTFINSASFGHLTLQAFFCSLTGSPDEARASIRHQLLEVLRLNIGLAGIDLIICADAVEALVDHAVHAVRQTAQAKLMLEPRALAIAAQVAAATARNGKLMQELESLDQINLFAQKLRRQVAKLHAKLQLPNVVQYRMVAYSALYVTPDLNEGSGEPSSLGADLSRVLESGTKGNVEELLQHDMRALILGDPGAGKSTMASKLVHDIAAKEIISGVELVPFLLIVRNHVQSLTAEHRTLLHYLEAASRKPNNIEPPAGAIEYLLLNGRAVVVIDGLDELGDASHRLEFARMIEGFANLYPLTRMVVTSRLVGYREAPLDDSLFAVYRVNPFTDQQVKRYARLWFDLDDRVEPGEREALCDSFLRESQELQDLRSNPLMLSLLCVLYTSEHYIPSRRPEVYERCAELLFESWDRSRGVTVPLRYRQQVRPIVQHLAWRMLSDPTGRRALSRSEMHRLLVDILTPKFRTLDDASMAADDFLDFCAGRAWVLTDLGTDVEEVQYGFVHRTFLEYFAAGQLVRSAAGPAAVWQSLKGRLTDSSWALVAQIAVQLVERSYEDGGSELLTLVVREYHESIRTGSVDTARALLLFAAGTLENVSPNYSVISDIAGASVDLACEVPWNKRIRDKSLGVADKVSEDGPLLDGLLWVRSPETRSLIAQAIAEHLHARSEDGMFSSANAIHCWLRMVVGSPGTVSHLISGALKGRQLPEPTATLERLLVHPSGADVDRFGIGPIFDYIRVGEGVLEPFVIFVLRLWADESSATLLEGVLTPVCEHLFRHRDSIACLSESLNVYVSLISECHADRLDSLSPPACGSALLLLWPFLRSKSQFFVDGRLADLALALQLGVNDDAARKTLAKWSLPTDIREFFEGQIRAAASRDGQVPS
jgi:hypothetical protein